MSDGAMPREMRIALTLFAVTIGIGLLTAVGRVVGYSPRPVIPSVAIGAFAFLLLTAALLFKTYSGRTWARVATNILFGLILGRSTYTLLKIIEADIEPPLHLAVAGAGFYLSNLAGLYFLNCSASRIWFALQQGVPADRSRPAGEPGG